MRSDLPSGTVTFLFTDVEGSTRLLHELGAERYAAALAEHRRVIREACSAEGGVEVDTQGDAFFFAFPTAPGALGAASAFTESLASGPISVRVGVHTGTPLLTAEGYVGGDVHFAARVAASAHGGQVILSAATASLVEQPLTDLGEHRLKDLEHAVSIFQVGEGSFPPLKTISNTNLPRPASSFLGREAELAEVLSRIEAGARLVTLTGPGGTGKTRLALEAASSLVPEYKAGVFWVGLASLRDPALVTETVAQTLGAKDGLAAHIGDRELLLLLDNLEQVIEAAPELSALLSACPNLTLLVTSRELLRIAGEVEYPVPPLAELDAVALFCARSQLEPSDEIAELCARLDSLPLAVELAAARTKALTPAQILERISQRLDLLKGGRDADPRQQTLRATIEWSYGLLSLEEQQLFARLSVFAGGCTLEAAEEVCDADLVTLQSLVEKSLLRFTPSDSGGRYWMLETVRELAAERLLDSSGAEDTKQRHVEFFLQLADEAEPELRGANAGEWLDRLEDEHHNLRAALSRVAERGQNESYVRLAGALARFWWTRAYLDEGQRWLDEALTRPGKSPEARARALRGLGYLAWASGERDLAFSCHEQALDLYRQIGDSVGIAMSLMNLGVGWREEGDLPRARRLMEEALSMQRVSGDPSGRAHSLGQLGLLALAEGDVERASELCEEGLSLARDVGNDYTASIILRAAAPVALQRGDHAQAAEHFAQGLAISMQLGYQGALSSGLKGLAAAAAATGDHDRAARMLGAANALDERVHGTPNPPEPPDDALFLAVARSHLGDERKYDGWAEGRSMSIERAVEYALASLD